MKRSKAWYRSAVAYIAGNCTSLALCPCGALARWGVHYSCGACGREATERKPVNVLRLLRKAIRELTQRKG